MNVARSLSKVPEETGTFTPPPSPRSSYAIPQAVSVSSHEAAASSSSARKPTSTARRPTASRSTSRTKLDTSTIPSDSLPPTPSTPVAPRRAASSSAVSILTSSSSSKEESPSSPKTKAPVKGNVNYRDTPLLPHVKAVDSAPATIMYWSRAPVYGYLPTHNMRAHSVTLVEQTAWIFGGCDERECWGNLYSFDIDTMHWSHPETVGENPPRCRAHTATLVDKRIVFFGGGQGSSYYKSIYVFDTISRRWSQPTLPPPPPEDEEPNEPMPRRAHTAVLYNSKIWIFGGGNGVTALNDLWCLDVSAISSGRMRWERIETKGKHQPSPRGYHTANVIGNMMVVVGGSDGKECFSDIWCFNMDTLCWDKIPLVNAPKRLSHSATQVGSYLFIMGGHDGTEYTSELLFFNLVTLQYETRATLGKPPSNRGYHACIIVDSRLFLFGGFNGHAVYSDVHILDLAAAAYLPQVTSFSIDLSVTF